MNRNWSYGALRSAGVCSGLRSLLLKQLRTTGSVLLVGLCVHLFSNLNAQARAELPIYTPTIAVSGVIRVWGSTEMAGVLRKWEEGFKAHQPQIRFDDHLYGTASSIAGLYTGVADVALLGRDIWPIERTAFESVLHYDSTGIQVATGSYDVPKAAYALVLYVNRANPLSQLTLKQLAGVFGVPIETVHGTAISTWGELGLGGSWSQLPLHLYSFDYDNDKAIFFRRTIFAARYHSKDSIREFTNRINSDGSITDSGQLILDALANDPLGIAVSNPHYANDHVKPLALSADGKTFVMADKRSVMERAYPLSRPVWIHVNLPPAGRLDVKISEFLSYVLSEEGQECVIQDGTYLPLTAKLADEQSRKVKPPLR